MIIEKLCYSDDPDFPYTSLKENLCHPSKLYDSSSPGNLGSATETVEGMGILKYMIPSCTDCEKSNLHFVLMNAVLVLCVCNKKVYYTYNAQSIVLQVI